MPSLNDGSGSLNQEDKAILRQDDDFATLAEETADSMMDVLIQGTLARCLPNRLLQVKFCAARRCLMLTLFSSYLVLPRNQNLVKAWLITAAHASSIAT